MDVRGIRETVAQRRSILIAFAAGLMVGIAVYHGVLAVSGRSIVAREALEQQQARLDELRTENEELADEVFSPRARGSFDLRAAELPYDPELDAASAIDAARQAARQDGTFLMVIFGANWCLDCRTLHHHLESAAVADYTRDLFRFVNVDVGKFNQNRDVAASLGVSLSSGIPVAVVFAPDGRVIGTTNEGQLEPARYYSSTQILKFVRDIVEREKIVAPDAVD